MQALGSYSVRFGTKSDFSHTEIVFEPGDGVDHLMPDGTTQPDENGAIWCASATALDRMPEWSIYRPNELGGVRFKRFVVNPDHWLIQDATNVHFDPVQVASWFVTNQGHCYDWRHIFSFGGVIMNWIFSNDKDKNTCTEAVAEAMGFSDSWRFHPGNFPNVISRINQFVNTDTTTQ